MAVTFGGAKPAPAKTPTVPAFSKAAYDALRAAEKFLLQDPGFVQNYTTFAGGNTPRDARDQIRSATLRASLVDLDISTDDKKTLTGNRQHREALRITLDNRCGIKRGPSDMKGEFIPWPAGFWGSGSPDVADLFFIREPAQVNAAPEVASPLTGDWGISAISPIADALDKMRPGPITRAPDNGDALANIGIQFASQFIQPEKETTVNTIKIETRTFVNNQDVATMSPAQIYDLIAKQEEAIEKLRAIKNKPLLLKQEIEDRQAGIDALVKHLDTLV
jgi:hypothetical protein